MIILRLRTSSDAKNLLKKVKRMSKYAEEIEDILDECIENEEEDDDVEFREDYDGVTPVHRNTRRRYRKM